MTKLSRAVYMALVIEYGGGYFTLPKFNFNLIYDSGTIYVPNDVSHNEILASALQLPIQFSKEYFASICIDSNFIGESSSGRKYYTTSSPLRLKSGWDLYLNCAGGTSDSNSAYAYALKNPNTGEILVDRRGFSTTSNGNQGYFEPIIFMFEDAHGWAVISYMTNKKFSLKGKQLYGMSPSRIASNDSSSRQLYELLFTDVPNADNPYWPGGSSGTGTVPPGTFDDDSDVISDSPLPTLSAANTGFTRIYNPTLGQIQSLARYLWTTPDVIETIWNHIKKFFENPMEAIIGFNLVPVPVPDGGVENFALMYIDTGISMTVAANQFVDLDCGTLELKRYYGSALDQSPYTKISCFLPYIGTVNLNTDEVMGTTLQVKYRVDIVSGSCVAKIFIDGNCLYQYSGHCAVTIPISSADFSSYVSAAISVGKLAAAAITAGAGAAMAAGVAEVSQQTNQVVTTTQVTNTARNPSTGRQITTGTTTTVQTRESPSDQSSTQASFSGLSPQNVANTVGSIMSSKPHIEHSGSFSGNSGYLGVRRPFVIIERPNMCMPSNYNTLNGFPAMITMELGTCKGFTRVQQVQLTGLHATNPEQAEILELLKSGVIL